MNYVRYDSFFKTKNIPVTIHASDHVISGIYKVLLGTSTTDVDVSEYVTVKILPSITDFIGP